MIEDLSQFNHTFLVHPSLRCHAMHIKIIFFFHRKTHEIKCEKYTGAKRTHLQMNGHFLHWSTHLANLQRSQYVFILQYTCVSHYYFCSYIKQTLILLGSNESNNATTQPTRSTKCDWCDALRFSIVFITRWGWIPTQRPSLPPIGGEH